MLRVVTPPAEEPVPLDQLKAHLRISFADDDAMIAALGVAAREQVEHLCSRALVTTTYELALEGFPWPRPGGNWGGALLGWRGYALELPLPVASVVAITYTDDAGAEQTLDPDGYRIASSAPNRLVSPDGWPLLRCPGAPVAIRFVAGYGAAADVPESAKVAIKMLAGHWYEHREAVAEPSVGSGLSEVPMAVKMLLAPLAWGNYS